MATINQLPLLSDPQPGDQIPVWSDANGDTRRVPFSAFQAAVADATPIGYMTMIGNAVATDIVTQNVAVKVAGTTVMHDVTQGFSHSANRLTYTGDNERTFRVSAVSSFSSGNNNEIKFYVAKDGAIISISETYGTANSSGRYENAVVQTVLTLGTNSYVEVWAANASATTDVTVTDMSVIIEAVN